MADKPKPNLRSLSAATFNIRGHMLGGRYEIIRELGSGGMGKVYLAHETRANRYVAVKILHPSLFMDQQTVDRFLREAQVCLQLRHPNTTCVFDFGTTPEGLHYMVLELLRGRSLFDIVKQHGQIEYPWAVRIVAQVCGSLSEAHQLGIVHRDLKPENIFIEPRPGKPAFVKVLDFGIAKVIGDTSDRMTRPGEVFGTPAYMSPEQAAGQPTDGRSDIYALGVLMYEMLTGRPPFEGSSLKVLMAHATEEPPPLPMRLAETVPPELQELMRYGMLAKKPEDRPRTTRLLRKMILQAAGMLAPGDTVPDVRAVMSGAEEEPAIAEEFPAPDNGGPMHDHHTAAVTKLRKAKVRWRNVTTHEACTLLKTGQEGGVLNVDGAPLSKGSRLVLTEDDPGLENARVVVDVLGEDPSAEMPNSFRIRWVRVIAGDSYDNLVNVLTVLGLPADVAHGEETLSKGTYLVYEVDSGKLQHIKLNA